MINEDSLTTEIALMSTDDWQVIGRELCRPPVRALQSDGHIVVDSSVGLLVLCEVLLNQSTGEVERRMLRAGDLNVADG